MHRDTTHQNIFPRFSGDLMYENMKLNIIFENKNLVIINKPPDILVHPDKDQPDGTLMHWLLKKYPEMKKVGEKSRPGVVHRLDKDTTGLIIFAKNEKAYKYLTNQFKARKVKKKYYALVYGRVKDTRGIISYSLKRSPKKELKITVGRGKEALTRYEVIKEFYHKNKFYTLLDVKPETGRTHQIRVHLHKIGHPIVGDPKYQFKNLKPPYSISRQLLHAYSLKFKLISEETKKFQIDLPKDFKDFLNKLNSD